MDSEKGTPTLNMPPLAADTPYEAAKKADTPSDPLYKKMKDQLAPAPAAEAPAKK